MQETPVRRLHRRSRALLAGEGEGAGVVAGGSGGCFPDLYTADDFSAWLQGTYQGKDILWHTTWYAVHYWHFSAWMQCTQQHMHYLACTLMMMGLFSCYYVRFFWSHAPSLAAPGSAMMQLAQHKTCSCTCKSSNVLLRCLIAVLTYSHCSTVLTDAL
jgi:hypothetical protein